jgi:signal transduction histidine kinase
MKKLSLRPLFVQLSLAIGVLISFYFLKLPNKQIWLYSFQFILTVFAARAALQSQNKVLATALSTLAIADISYCTQVYIYPRAERDLFFILTTSFLYMSSFFQFSYYLYSKTKKSLPLIFRQPFSLVPAIGLIVTSSLFLIHPLAVGLLNEGLNNDRISAILSLISSVPLIVVSYFAILFVHKIEDILLPIGLFVISIVDWAIQYEFIKFGVSYFTYYDFMWCLGIILIFQNVVFAKNQPHQNIENKLSLRVFLKISILIAGLLPVYVFSFIHEAPDKAQIQVFIFSISTSLAIAALATQKFNEDLEQLGHELNAIFDTSTEAEGSAKTLKDEWLQTIAIAIKNKIQLKNTELKILENASREKYEMAKQVAHDIRSPLSLLTAIAKSEASAEEKNRFIQSVVERITYIADCLLAKHRSELTVKQGLLQPGIENILNEKKFDKSVIEKSLSLFLDTSSFAQQVAVQFDSQKLQTIISNALNNSIEASATEIGILYSQMSQKKPAIEIWDNGKGIPKDVLARLGTSQFSHGKQMGNGLGIYNAKKTLNEWGGDLMLVSDGESYTALRLIFQSAES